MLSNPYLGVMVATQWIFRMISVKKFLNTVDVFTIKQSLSEFIESSPKGSTKRSVHVTLHAMKLLADRDDSILETFRNNRLERPPESFHSESIYRVFIHLSPPLRSSTGKIHGDLSLII